MRIIAEDRDRRRVDHRVAVAVVPLATMIRVHRRILDRQVERAGAAQVFLLGAGAGEEAAAGLDSGGEVERHHVESLGLVATMGGERRLVGYLVGRLVRTCDRSRVGVVGGVVDGRRYRARNVGSDLHQTSRPDVLARHRDTYRFFA